MLRGQALSVYLATAIAAQPLAALAQQNDCLKIACRAVTDFRTCDRPHDGAKMLSARVLAVSRECSNNIVSMQIEDETADALPAIVEIDLGPCVYFSGKVGDTT